MMKVLKITGFLAVCIFISIGFSSCVYEDEEPQSPYQKERLILIYAVAANNLEYNLKLDMNEIVQAAPSLNLNNNAVLVYSVDNTGECRLRQLTKNGLGGFGFTTVAEFPELPLSTSKERIEEVIDYVADNYDYPDKGLVLWSHADGWIPWEKGSTPDEEKRRSFGADIYQGTTYKTNINELAVAIPEGMFDFIWFDCCYMANIETVYQLRNKTPYIVGSVLEIAANGMPYDLTMPYLLQKEADLEGAAYSFFTYYDRRNVAVSISIMDTQYLEQLADASREVMTKGTAPTSFSGIQTYQRNLNVKFYDMAQLLNRYTGVPEESEVALKEAFAKVVIYKYISDLDFNSRPINVKDYSGLSMHYYVPENTYYADYYRELDWYKATR